MTTSLKQLIQDEARRLGFILAGVTTPDPPPHAAAFEAWLEQGRHAAMDYLATERSRARRADPRRILPECKSILVLAVPYSKPSSATTPREGIGAAAASLQVSESAQSSDAARGRVAAYAWGDDYHNVLPQRLRGLVAFIEGHVGHSIANRWYTDSGPVLERDLAQRAGLGWIGKNTCLINPKRGSYFLLAEILLDLELEPDTPLTTDHCGTCTRCLEACPTSCILPDRTIDAARCISYLTIELKGSIPLDLRPLVDDWIFGCDICQMVCPWNRFAPAEGDEAFRNLEPDRQVTLPDELQLQPAEFNRKFKNTPVQRARRRGYLRNVAVVLGNVGTARDLPALEVAANDPEPLVRAHASWAIEAIRKRSQ